MIKQPLPEYDEYILGNERRCLTTRLVVTFDEYLNEMLLSRRIRNEDGLIRGKQNSIYVR